MPENPYQSPQEVATPPDARARVPTGRWQLFCECFAASSLVAVVSTLMSVAVWDHRVRIAGTADEYNWSPLQSWWGMISLIWVGFLIHQLAPTGWLFWLGCGLGVWKQQRRFFALSILAAVIFGWSWPWTYFALMSV